MNDLPLSISSGLIIYGPLGIFCVVEALVIAFLYRENKSLQKKIDDLIVQSRDSVIEPLKALQQTTSAMLTLLQNISNKK